MRGAAAAPQQSKLMSVQASTRNATREWPLMSRCGSAYKYQMHKKEAAVRLPRELRQYNLASGRRRNPNRIVFQRNNMYPLRVLGGDKYVVHERDVYALLG